MMFQRSRHHGDMQKESFLIQQNQSRCMSVRQPRGAAKKSHLFQRGVLAMLYCFQEVNHINRRHTRWRPTKWMILRFLIASDMELHLALKNSNQQFLLFLTASFLIIRIQQEFDALAKWAAKGWFTRLLVSTKRTVHDDLQQNKQSFGCFAIQLHEHVARLISPAFNAVQGTSQHVYE